MLDKIRWQALFEYADVFPLAVVVIDVGKIERYVISWDALPELERVLGDRICVVSRT
jgi:hypothetical protein